MDAKKEEISVKSILLVILKYKYLILLTFLATVITVAVINTKLIPIYKATASIMVKFGHEHLYQPEVGRSSGKILGKPESIMNSELRILNSRDLIEKVITEIGIEKLYPNSVAKENSSSVNLSKGRPDSLQPSSKK